MSDGVFRESCKNTITVIESAEDKCLSKFLQILPRHKSYVGNTYENNRAEHMVVMSQAS